MGIVLFIIGAIISFFFWITIKEMDYVEKKCVQNGGKSIEDSAKPIYQKIKMNETITIKERLKLWNWYINKFGYAIFKFLMYSGLLLAFLGLSAFIYDKVFS